MTTDDKVAEWFRNMFDTKDPPIAEKLRAVTLKELAHLRGRIEALHDLFGMLGPNSTRQAVIRTQPKTKRSRR
jgi:hypothetical protein